MPASISITTTRLFTIVGASLLVAACSSGPDPGSSMSQSKMPDPAPTPSATQVPPPPPSPPVTPLPYPAFHSDPPQLVAGTGKVLAAPKVALIVYANEPRAAAAESFLKKVGPSVYWSSVTKEYGVGPITPLPTITRSDDAPTTLANADIKAWLAAQLDGTHAEYPVPDDNTIYMMVYPASTVITTNGTPICGKLYAYHAEAPIAGGRSVPYIVIPQCPSAQYSDTELLTIAMSHELVETALNPLVETAPAYAFVDRPHSAWLAAYGQVEAGDLCVGHETTPPELGVVVQRTWSNAAANAGHHPCVPAGNAPFVLAAPVLNTIDIPQVGALPGVTIPVGMTKAVDLQLSSDGPTTEFTVTVSDLAQLQGAAPQLSLLLDRKSGKNGDVLHLNIRALRDGQTNATKGVSTFVITARSKSGDTTVWPAFVAN
jgi:hypothetical protein